MITRILVLTLFLAVSAFAQVPPPLAPASTIVKNAPAISMMAASATEALTVTPKASNPQRCEPGAPRAQEGGTCVVNSLANWLGCSIEKPVYRISDKAWLTAWYFWATTHDSFADNDNDIDGGTDVETAAKKLKQWGVITKNAAELLWTGEILKYLQNVGPGVMSSLWFASMDHPNPATGEVTVTPNSGVRGGHAYCALYWRPAEWVKLRGKLVWLPERVYFQQSWLGYKPFDGLPEGSQIFWVSMPSFKRIVNAGRGTLWASPKARPKVDLSKKTAAIDRAFFETEALAA